jgi:hypothetical protein
MWHVVATTQKTLGGGIAGETGAPCCKTQVSLLSFVLFFNWLNERVSSQELLAPQPSSSLFLNPAPPPPQVQEFKIKNMVKGRKELPRREDG